MSTESSFATEEQFERDAIRGADIPKSPDTLERDIDARRAHIENIVDALENKLSPGQLFDQALAFTKSNGGEFVHNLGTSIKNNPVPVILATVGVTWLMLGQNQRPSNAGPSMFSQIGEKLGATAESVGDALTDAKNRVSQSVHQVGDKASHLVDSASEKIEDARQRTTAGTLHVRDTLKSQAEGAQDALLRQGRNLQGTVEYMLKEQPLALAAIGIALGAALGAALPSTPQEDELFGKASDQIANKAKTAIGETWGAVSDLGQDVVEGLKNSKAPTTAG